MKNKLLKFVLKCVSVVVCMFVIANFLSGCSFGRTDASFSVSGYVFDESGLAVEGVTISSELGEVLTDESGKFTISGIEDSIIISPSKAGYFFGQSSKQISSSSDNANFTASKEYIIQGNVHNNNIAVPNARVEVTSLAGEFVTTTDEVGAFKVSGVAGIAKISCEANSVTFYEVEASIDNPIVSINTTSSFTLNLSSDDARIDYSKINMTIDGVRVPVLSQVVLNEVNCGQVIELSSVDYKLEKTRIVINKINQVEEIFASKIYSISGSVHSGNTTLSNASIKIDGEIVATTDQNGWFYVGNLVSQNNVTVTYQNFDFDSVDVDSTQSESLDFNGTKDVSVSLEYDKIVSDEIMFDFAGASRINAYEYLLSGITLGENVNITSNYYHIKNNNFVIDDKDVYNASLFALYGAVIIIPNDINATIYLDGNVADQSALENLYGTHNITAAYENYVFSTVSVNYDNSEANLSYQIPYNVTLKVISGDINLLNATAKIGENEYIANSNGIITITNLVGESEILVSGEGYNSAKLAVTEEKNQEVNLSYNISGVVKTGKYTVAYADVLVGETKLQTNANGKFEVNGLFGTNTISASKQYYEFDSQTVSSSASVEINGTYSIFGTLSNGEEYFANRTTMLIATDGTSNIQYATTNANGEFSFTGLNSRYWLLPADNSDGLRPELYEVTAGGVYNFGLSGFSISGKVTSGDLPVENAYVIAGSMSTYTNEKGEYAFELLTSECTVSVSKQGYTFSEPIMVSEDSQGVNFTASYSVSGVVSSGTLNIAGVGVYNGETLLATTNNNGEFEISNLEGAVTLTFEKQGYVFDGTASVSTPTELEVSCMAVKVVSVLSGDIEITDFEYYVNGEIVGTSQESSVNIVANIGDRVSISKQGYTFTEITIGEEDRYTVSATYSVSGKVKSGDTEISGVIIKVNGKTLSADYSGNFSVSGLSGTTEILVQKANFNSFTYTAEGFAENITIDLSYTITGQVYVGSKQLSGVTVISGTQSVVTDDSGKFTLSNMVGKFSLSFSKDGYTFNSIENQFGAQSFTINAFYSISGKVTSGENAISGASVEVFADGLSAPLYATTNANGEFTVRGVKGIAELIVNKDGYSTATISGFSDVSNDNIINLTYSVTLNFTTSGVLIYINGSEYLTTNTNSITIPNLAGTNTLKFEKKNSSFVPNNFQVKEPGSFSVSAEFAYDVYGYVKTDSGLAVPNVDIKVASNSTTTDENGYFELKGVAGTLTLNDSGVLSQIKQITADGAYNFTVDYYKFAYFLYEQAYKKLDSAASVQIIGDGTVLGKGSLGIITIDTTQYVHSLYKKDNNGMVLKQNLNYGEETAGIDPKISLVILYNSNTGETKYQELRGGSVTGTTTANHTVSDLTNTTATEIQSKYGSMPYAYSPYIFSSSNASSSTISQISVNSSGNYTFTINIPTNQPNYATQIKALAPDGTTFSSFDYLNLTYEIDKNGWIVSVTANEKYYIHQIVDVTVTSSVTYRYLTRSSNIKIDDIDISSNSALNASLKESSQTEIENLNEIQSLDLVNSLIYGN